MTTLERIRLRVAPALLLALALTTAATAQPIACENFESATGCGWTMSTCDASVCSGTCVDNVCGCDPAPTFAFLHGTWSGGWEDTRYGVSGSAQASFDVTCSGVAATGSIDLSQLGLGEEAGSGSGTVSGQALDFTFSAATVGNGSGSLSAVDDSGSGSGTVTGVLSFGGFTFMGTAGSTTISGTFAFTSPSGGYGNVSLTKD